MQAWVVARDGSNRSAHTADSILWVPYLQAGAHSDRRSPLWRHRGGSSWVQGEVCEPAHICHPVHPISAGHSCLALGHKQFRDLTLEVVPVL